MKFTLSWLKDHLETTATLDEILEKLTMIGLEVEGVENPGAKLGVFRIVKVLSAEKHPNADKLRVLSVDRGDGSEPLQVVCGAPNARAGLIGVLGLPGDYVPGLDVTLSVGEIRGVKSNGMMCSERELQLSDEHNGIIELPEDAPVGARFVDYRGLDEPVIEIAITPNRPDCLGVRGVARDLAAAGLGTLKPMTRPAIAGAFESPVKIALEFTPETADACPVFAGRLVRGVKNGPAPKWIQDRLKAIGLRPINALVDITNYLTFDRGRPLHVYDTGKISGTIRARLGKAGESFVALDGKTYIADEAACVIADDEKVLGLGGIMGGEHSGSEEHTTDVLIESAYFDPYRTARTGRRFGINSDARYRFERGIDPAFVVEGLDWATQMVMDLCGGEPSLPIVAGAEPITEKTVSFPVSEVKRLANLDLSKETIFDTLKALGFTVRGNGDVVDVTAPSWRPDIHGKADLVEEVVRIIGLEHVLPQPLPRPSTVQGRLLTPIQVRTRKAKRLLAARGLTEAVTWSFVSSSLATLFGGGKPELALANPISADMSDMRPSLIPGLAAAAARNIARGFNDLAVFEVGQIFLGDKPENQFTAATVLRRGTAKVNGTARHWSGNAGGVDVFDAKSDALALLETLGLDVAKVQIARSAPSWFHPGRSGTLQLGPQNVFGWFGELHPSVLEAIGLQGPVVVAEILLERLPVPKAKASKSKGALNLSALLPVKRDFAFVVDEVVEAGKIAKAAEGAVKGLVSGVSVFDVFRGDALGATKKSVAIEVTLQPADKTMTDEEIEAATSKIIAAVSKATGAVLRG